MFYIPLVTETLPPKYVTIAFPSTNRMPLMNNVFISVTQSAGGVQKMCAVLGLKQTYKLCITKLEFMSTLCC